LPKLNLPEYPRPDLFDLEFFCARQERVFVGDVENVEAEEDLIWRLDPPLKGGKASEHSEPLQNGKRMSAPAKNIKSGLPCCSTLRVRSLFGSGITHYENWFGAAVPDRELTGYVFAEPKHILARNAADREVRQRLNNEKNYIMRPAGETLKLED